MTKEEFLIISRAIRAVYPNMLADDGAKDVWFSMLSDLPYTQVSLALQTHMMTSKYPPTIADLRVNHAEQQRGLTDLEAWAMVRKAIKNGTYGAEEEFDRLPEMVQKAVGAASNIRQWAQSDSGMLETIEAHFLKSFRIQRDRAIQDAQISPAVKALIAETKQNLLEAKG